VLVLGLNEGVLPKAHNVEGILSDADRAELAALGVPLADSCSRAQIEEQNIIYTVLTAANEQLLLFSPRAKRDGKSLTESFICGRLKAIFPNLKVEVPINRNIFERWSEHQVNVQPKLSKSMARKLYGEHLWLSISRVEKYNSCAFSYFLQYGLFAKPRATAEFALHSRGSLLHEILARYFVEVNNSAAQYESINKSDCEAEIHKITKAAIVKDYSVMSELSPVFGYFARRLENVAFATAWNIVKFYRQSEFRPFGFEIKFRPRDYGGKFDYPSPEIDVNGEVVGSLAGDIDRVDVAKIGEQNYITIVDYKSSDKKISADLVECGVQIQPLAYANMMSQTINAKAAAMLYMPMSEPLITWETGISSEKIEKKINEELRMNGWILDDESVKFALDCNRDPKGGSEFVPTAKSALHTDLSAALELANKAIARAAEGMIDGNISVNMRKIKGHDSCRWCEFGSICGK